MWFWFWGKVFGVDKDLHFHGVYEGGYEKEDVWQEESVIDDGGGQKGCLAWVSERGPVQGYY